MNELLLEENRNDTCYKPEISIIIPVYNESENVAMLAERIAGAFEKIAKTYEIIFIDDGSSDNTPQILKQLSAVNPKIKAVIFRRNFGQTAGLSAGFDYAKGNIIITMDGDLQNDPEDIPRLLEKLDEGYDVVSGWRKDRKDKLISRKVPSMIANRIISKLTGVYLHDYGCALKAYKAEIAKEIPLYGELHRFIPALASIEGAKIIEIPVNHYARKFGKSKYNILRTFKVILDLITVVFLRKFITRPLHMFGRPGLFSLASGILICAYLAFEKIFYHLEIGNRPLLLLGALLIITGIQFINTGIIAEIQIRTYYESQNKSIYKVRETYGLKD